MVDNQLEVPLGQDQGLRVNQLAVLEDHANNSLMMLSISKLGNNKATLLPLNANLKIDSFLGKEARFWSNYYEETYFLYIFTKFYIWWFFIC